MAYGDGSNFCASSRALSHAAFEASRPISWTGFVGLSADAFNARTPPTSTQLEEHRVSFAGDARRFHVVMNFFLHGARQNNGAAQ